MWFHHLSQIVVLNNGEFPKVSTGWENVVGDLSIGYKKANRNSKVISKICKFDNDYVYTLILYDKENDHYDVVSRKYGEHLSEHYGYKHNNENIDSMKVGSKIKKDEIVYKSVAFDEDMNMKFGRNTRIAYLVDPQCIEDAIKVSAPYAKAMSSTKFKSISVSLNDNDILLNMYGDKKVYKSFPEVGEDVKDRTLCVSRRINHNNSLHNLKNSNLRKQKKGDIPYHPKGTVIDIDIFCNKPLEEIPGDDANNQIVKYYGMTLEYYKKLYKELGKIIASGSEYSDELGAIYAKARDVLEPTTCWANTDNNLFNNIIIEFTLSYSDPLHKGSKLTNRFGGKGVISKILPAHMMPTDENGVPVDMVVNALGIIARLNTGQLYEHELNGIANDIILQMKGVSDDEKMTLLLDFIRMANKHQYKEMVKYIRRSDQDTIDTMFKDIKEHGILIEQPPTATITMKKLAKLYERFNIKKKKVHYYDEYGNRIELLSPIIIGETYIVRLKHEGESSFSVRSQSLVSSRTNLPIKSNASKKGTAMYSDSSISFGNMEISNLLICNDINALDALMRMHSSSVTGRKKMGKLYECNPLGKIEIDIDDDDKSRPAEILDAYLLSAGLNINFDYSNPNVDEYDDAIDIPDFEEGISFKDLLEFEDDEIEIEEDYNSSRDDE
jgi:DNA-directed RNA polymerase beta subunit